MCVSKSFSCSFSSELWNSVRCEETASYGRNKLTLTANLLRHCRSQSPLFVFEILLAKLILHSATLEFPRLCEYHIIAIIWLLFTSLYFSLYRCLPYTFLFALYFLNIFGSYSARISSVFLILQHKMQARDQQAAPAALNPVSTEKEARWGEVRS